MVILRAAKSGVITGLLLAVARIGGETVPLLFTALSNQFYRTSMEGPMLETENRINQMEVDIDHAIISTIGRRQPTARDLRFLMAISRTTQNLERAGDGVARIARPAPTMALDIMGEDNAINLEYDGFLRKLVVKGADVRHTPMEKVGSVAR